MRQYGLSLDQYVHMFNFQNGRCGNTGCDKDLDLKSRDTCVDHCHETGKVRSLLCAGCNTALGMIKENAKRAEGLAGYIFKHSTVKNSAEG